MKILLTGATGYIGKRLLLELIYHGHQLVCTVRDKKRFYAPASILKKIEVIEVDFLDFKSLKKYLKILKVLITLCIPCQTQMIIKS